MSETPNKSAEPTENQGGGTAPIPSNPTTESTVATAEEPEAVAAEPTENQGGGGD